MNSSDSAQSEDNSQQRTRQKNRNLYYWACARCLTGACWAGKFYCDEYKTAGLVVLSREQGVHLNREHADYIDDPEIRASEEDYADPRNKPKEFLSEAADS